MGFRFLHTADWQIGKTFGSFDPETSTRLQEARFDLITKLATVAKERSLRHVLVAGDVFDHVQPTQRVLGRALDRLAAASGLEWWLLPGNHDPAGPDSLWTRLEAMGLPPNVHPLTRSEPHTIEPGVAILPAPWMNKRPGRDLTEAFLGMETEAATRIGFAHGGVEAFGSDPDRRQIIPYDRAETAALAYLALGDWHGARPAGTRAWYPGTPEPDSFTNNDRGKALIVDTDDPDNPELVQIGQFEWELLAYDCRTDASPRGELEALFPTAARQDQRLVQLSLSGQIGLREKVEIDQWIQATRARLAFLNVQDDDLQVVQDPETWRAMLGDGAARAVAQRLVDRAQSGEAAAHEALQLMASFAQAQR